jgi:hypothetical protein
MSDKWKSAALLFILVLAATAFALLCKYLGLFVPRMNWGFGSYTINETLSNVVGYFVAAFLVSAVWYMHTSTKSVECTRWLTAS